MSQRLTASDAAKLVADSAPANALELLLDAIDLAIKDHIKKNTNPVGLRNVFAAIPASVLDSAGAKQQVNGYALQQHLIQEVLNSLTVSGFTYSMESHSRSNPPANPIVNLFWKTDLTGSPK